MAKKPSDGGKSTGPGSDGPVAGRPYVVLARKYRPATFVDMIGQDALVQTLRNAFKTGRIAQAYMLTGVRGVGKTTTARILARALNYEREGISVPTIDMPEPGRHCPDIMDGRHPDVIEMDAASNTGVEDVREIIESARYKPILARMKVFIIDEVHMLSKNAFNALLKTLEEPPEHVKFIFATTELRKVPVTVLSRCQRFDLRRVEGPVLAEHFRKIVETEHASAETDALALIARAAEGSVRDGLSMLDQAIAMGSGQVTAQDVRAMLGLADRGRILDLVDVLFAGQPGRAIEQLAKLHSDGAEPLQVLIDLAEAVHAITRARVGAETPGSDALSPDERKRLTALAATLSVPLLARAWQMLTKGIEETAKSASALAAAEMVLVRLAYTADLPTPDEIIKRLGTGASASVAGAAGGAAQSGGGRPTINERPTPSAPQAVDTPRGSTTSAAASRPVALAKSATPTAQAQPAPSDGFQAPQSFLDKEIPLALSPDVYGADAPPADSDDDAWETAADIGITVQRAYAPLPQTFEEIVDLAGRSREIRLKVHLEEYASFVRLDVGQRALELHMLPGAPKSLANELREFLNGATGKPWMIALAPRMGQQPLAAVARERAQRELEALKTHPAVAEVLRVFPEAKVASVRPIARKKT